MRTENPTFLIVDLFCGAGGTTTGFAMANRNGNSIATVMACVNHDHLAIESHWKNHPEVEHYEEDITKMYGAVQTFKIWGQNAYDINDYKTYSVYFKSPEMLRLQRMVDIYRACYPDAKVILWASLECTNFSKAKGGQPRDADSRTLADHLDRYILALDPDYVQIENVVEFMSWGPLDANGKPVSRKSGSDWMRWRKQINSLGYRDDWKELNSADFGAYTSRNRLFGCFAKPNLPIIWPDATHAKKPVTGNMFVADLQRWKAVKEVLDFNDEGESIFNRKKELVDASLERIEAGIIKFVGGSNDAFILKYNSRDKNGKHSPPSVDDPCPTVAVQNRLAICFLAKYYSGKPAGKVIPVTGPAGTIKTSDGQSLITCKPFIMNTNFTNVGSSIDEPAKTLTASRHHPYLVRPEFIVQRNTGNAKGRVVSIESPARTLTATGGNQELVKPCFLTKYHGNGENLLSVNNPASTLSTKDRLALIQAIWLYKTYTGYKNVSSIDSPAGTLMPCDKHRLISCEGFILNPSHGGHCTSLTNPCVVIVARQDKAPLYFIQFKFDANVTIAVYETDTPVMIRIKNLMAFYGIIDIKMRMLKVLELLQIQGFPVNYILVGNQSDQKKFIGNSVVPDVVKAWCEAMDLRIFEDRMAA